MTYQVIQEFRLKGAVQSLGSFINLSEQAALKLKGFVQTVPDDQPTTFEKEGDPVSCPYWYRVCWAVQQYQRHCTRNTGCLTFKFLQQQDKVATPETLKERQRSTETVKQHLQAGGRL
jgi:hypothetical protein